MKSKEYQTNIAELRNLFDTCIEDRLSEYTRGQRNSRFLKGEHHTEADKKDYRKDGLIPYSIPLLTTKLTRILSEQRANRRDWKLLGRGEEDELGAEILTGVYKYIDDINEFDMTESDIYKDGSKLFGCVEVSIDDSKNPEGEISLRKVPYYEFYWDSNSVMYDLSDAQFCGRMEWVTRQNVKNTYGKDIEDNPIEFSKTGIKNIKNYFRSDKGKDLICVITHEERFTKKSFGVKNLTTGDFEEFATKDEAETHLGTQAGNLLTAGLSGQTDINNIMTVLPDLRIVPIEAKKIKRTIFTGSQILLEEEIDSDLFSFIPYFQLFDDGDYYCLIDLVHDTQKWFDRLVSMIDRATVKNIKGNNYELNIQKLDPLVKNDVDNELKKLSRGGYTLKVLENGALLPIQVGNISTQEIAQLSGVQSFIEDLMGASGAGYAQDKADQTATEASIKEKASQMAGFLFLDNLRFWKKLVGQKILELIPQVYTRDRQIRINGSAYNEKVMKVLSENGVYKESAMNPSLGWMTVPSETIKNTKVDLIVSEAEPSDSMRIAQSNLLLSYNDSLLQRGYPPLPPEILLHGSKLPPTLIGQINEWYNEQKQAQAEAQQAEMKMKEAEMTMKGIDTMSKIANTPTSEEKAQEKAQEKQNNATQNKVA